MDLPFEEDRINDLGLDIDRANDTIDVSGHGHLDATRVQTDRAIEEVRDVEDHFLIVRTVLDADRLAESQVISINTPSTGGTVLHLEKVCNSKHDAEEASFFANHVIGGLDLGRKARGAIGEGGGFEGLAKDDLGSQESHSAASSGVVGSPCKECRCFGEC